MKKEQLIEMIQKQILDGEVTYKLSVEDLWKLESQIDWKH